MSLKKSRKFAKFGIGFGMMAVLTLFCALLNNCWLYTYEQTNWTMPGKFEIIVFRLGLWSVCSTIILTNNHNYTVINSFETINNSYVISNAQLSSNCQSISYWDNTIGLNNEQIVPFTSEFLNQMRLSTPLLALSLLLLLTATSLTIISYCSGIDYRTIVACAMFLFAGLALGSGLFLYAVAVSDTYLNHYTNAVNNDGMNRSNGWQPSLKRSSFIEFEYGWCFLVAAIAFILTEFPVFFLIMAYTERFVTVEQMVYKTIPGAKRKLNEIMVAMRTLHVSPESAPKNLLAITPSPPPLVRQHQTKVVLRHDPKHKYTLFALQEDSFRNARIETDTDEQHHRYYTLPAAYQQLSCYYQHQQVYGYRPQQQQQQQQSSPMIAGHSKSLTRQRKPCVRFANVTGTVITVPAIGTNSDRGQGCGKRTSDGNDDDDDDQGSAV